MRALLFAIAICLGLPASASAQTHRFSVPDPAHKLDASLPWASEYAPPPEYDRWWKELAACEGLQLPPFYVMVRFYFVNAVHFYDTDRPQFEEGTNIPLWAVGISFLRSGEIFVGLPYVMEEVVIKHEMAHFLMAFNGLKPGHPPEIFEQCGVTTVYWGENK